jgi:hypothetical protein
MLIEGKTPWEFCVEWYRESEIHQAVAANGIPRDVLSREFASWLTTQYRLAMHRGMELAMEAAKTKEK